MNANTMPCCRNGNYNATRDFVQRWFQTFHNEYLVHEPHLKQIKKSRKRETTCVWQIFLSKHDGSEISAVDAKNLLEYAGCHHPAGAILLGGARYVWNESLRHCFGLQYAVHGCQCMPDFRYQPTQHPLEGKISYEYLFLVIEIVWGIANDCFGGSVEQLVSELFSCDKNNTFEHLNIFLFGDMINKVKKCVGVQSAMKEIQILMDEEEEEEDLLSQLGSSINVTDSLA